MSIIESIKTSRLALRKEADKAVEFSILTLLFGELETVSKRNGEEITDERALGGIRKLIKSNNEAIKMGAPSEKLERENVYLESFIPKQMSEGELRQAIAESGLTEMREIMPYLSAKYAGLYDKALASKIARSL